MEPYIPKIRLWEPLIIDEAAYMNPEILKIMNSSEGPPNDDDILKINDILTNDLKKKSTIVNIIEDKINNNDIDGAIDIINERIRLKQEIFESDDIILIDKISRTSHDEGLMEYECNNQEVNEHIIKYKEIASSNHESLKKKLRSLNHESLERELNKGLHIFLEEK